MSHIWRWNGFSKIDTDKLTSKRRTAIHCSFRKCPGEVPPGEMHQSTGATWQMFASLGCAANIGRLKIQVLEGTTTSAMDHTWGYNLPVHRHLRGMVLTKKITLVSGVSLIFWVRRISLIFIIMCNRWRFLSGVEFVPMKLGTVFLLYVSLKFWWNILTILKMLMAHQAQCCHVSGAYVVLGGTPWYLWIPHFCIDCEFPLTWECGLDGQRLIFTMFWPINKLSNVPFNKSHFNQGTKIFEWGIHYHSISFPSILWNHQSPWNLQRSIFSVAFAGPSNSDGPTTPPPLWRPWRRWRDRSWALFRRGGCSGCTCRCGSWGGSWGSLGRWALILSSGNLINITMENNHF